MYKLCSCTLSRSARSGKRTKKRYLEQLEQHTCWDSSAGKGRVPCAYACACNAAVTWLLEE